MINYFALVTLAPHVVIHELPALIPHGERVDVWSTLFPQLKLRECEIKYKGVTPGILLSVWEAKDEFAFNMSALRSS